MCAAGVYDPAVKEKGGWVCAHPPAAVEKGQGDAPPGARPCNAMRQVMATGVARCLAHINGADLERNGEKGGQLWCAAYSLAQPSTKAVTTALQSPVPAA